MRNEVDSKGWLRRHDNDAPIVVTFHAISLQQTAKFYWRNKQSDVFGLMAFLVSDSEIDLPSSFLLLVCVSLRMKVADGNARLHYANNL